MQDEKESRGLVIHRDTEPTRWARSAVLCFARQQPRARLFPVSNRPEESESSSLKPIHCLGRLLLNRNSRALEPTRAGGVKPTNPRGDKTHEQRKHNTR